MRRPTKASSAGSTQGQASRLGSFFGAFAVRDGSLRVDGSGASSIGWVRSGLRARLVLAALLATTTYLVLAAGSATPLASAATCSNAAARTGASANLPDCRAYELVSPPDVQPNFLNGTRAAASGDRLSFYSFLIPPDVPSYGNVFLSTRGAAGWSTGGVTPPQSTADDNLCGPQMVFWSTDFGRGLLMDGPYYGAACPQDDPPLVAGEPRGFQNLFVRDNAGGTYQLVNLTPDGVEPSDAFPQAASSDLSHVVFEEAAQLTADAPVLSSGETNTYIWSDGVVRLVTVLPDGTSTQGSIAAPQMQGFLGELNSGGASYAHALSDDGSRVFFVAGENLYLRQHADRSQSPLDGSGACSDPALACTLQVDASQGPGPGGGGTFMWATPDGSQVFFTAPASSGLTADTEPGSGQNLYRYDADSGALTDLTAVSDAQARGVSGASDDGSYLYFVADGALASGATAGQPNLYLRHAGSTTFIATLAPIAVTSPGREPYEACDWTLGCLTARVSHSGRFLAFNSTKSLTGYDSVPDDPKACDLDRPRQANGSPCAEIYLYDATAGELSCASCNPSGAPPTAATFIPWPGRLVDLNQLTSAYPRRSLSEDGRVFFDSLDALAPADSNGKTDVYEYENGQVHLLSSGTSSNHSLFQDASASGEDVFFITDQALVPQDGDAANSIYDARVGGGFPSAAVPPPCSGDACKPGASSPPPADGNGSSSFAGPGNPNETTRCTISGIQKLSSSDRSNLAKGGRARLRLKVNCSGTVTLAGTAKVGKKNRRVVRSSAKARKAGAVSIPFALSKSARAQLRSKRSLTVRLVVRFKDARPKVVRFTLKSATSMKGGRS